MKIRFSLRAADDLEKIRASKPLVYNITNAVVTNTTANALLSIGASPVMAHSPDEAAAMAAIAGALVLNMGTPDRELTRSMVAAGKEANRRGKPVVFDPVGVGATPFRDQTARDVVEVIRLTAIRGNASEVLALAGGAASTKGVDSVHCVDDAASAAGRLAEETGAVVAVTGPVDFVTDGRRSLRVANGHPLMSAVTGTGCAATALIGAFLAVDEDPLCAVAAALACWGVAGEEAARVAHAPGSYQVALLDALYLLSPEKLAARAQVTQA